MTAPKPKAPAPKKTEVVAERGPEVVELPAEAVVVPLEEGSDTTPAIVVDMDGNPAPTDENGVPVLSSDNEDEKKEPAPDPEPAPEPKKEEPKPEPKKPEPKGQLAKTSNGKTAASGKLVPGYSATREALAKK